MKRFYDSKRQSPVLGTEQFIEKVRGREVKLVREIPRYQRRALQVTPEQVIQRVSGMYKVSKGEILVGTRGKENEARRVAMYLVRQCCDRTLNETASLFGLGSYGAVGWDCHGVKTMMELDKNFKDKVETIAGEFLWRRIP